MLREELPLHEVDVAGIVLAFVERLAEREELDLDACGEFLVLVSALLELKARGLFAGEILTGFIIAVLVVFIVLADFFLAMCECAPSWVGAGGGL